MLMDPVLSALLDKSISVFLLCVGIYTLWRAWRLDTTTASAERNKMIAAIEALGDKFDKLERRISDFFLSKFPDEPI